MHTNTSSQELAKQIERMVDDFVDASRIAASAAVERAFASASGKSARKRPARPRSTKQIARRSPGEMAALSERLYEAICAKPGETMGVIAMDIDAAPRELQVPAAGLKRAGRIRSAGQRQFTRYFPMVKSTTKSG